MLYTPSLCYQLLEVKGKNTAHDTYDKTCLTTTRTVSLQSITLHRNTGTLYHDVLQNAGCWTATLIAG